MTFIQTEIDFTNRCENNAESQRFLDANKAKINGDCLKVYELLRQGKILTVDSMYKEHSISSPPRRILDLKRKGIPVKDRTIGNSRFKEYYL